MIKIVIIIVMATFISCRNSHQPTSNTMAEVSQVVYKETLPLKEMVVDNGEEDGWGADVRLSIVEISKTDTSTIYTIQSLDSNKTVGFTIIIPTDLPSDKNELAQFLTIQSCGDISNNFIQTLSRLYSEPLHRTCQFVTSKRVVFIDLNEFAKFRLGQEPVNRTTAKEMKLFFESDSEEHYGELFINVNELERWVEIREKDAGYRRQVVKGLTTCKE